jgi:iron(III) transport system ATP-binding protein
MHRIDVLPAPGYVAAHRFVQPGESEAAAHAVSVRGVVKEFEVRRRAMDERSVRAVDEVSFDVAPGELLVLLGPSGCGKTTTLRIIAGLEEPDAGEVWLGPRMVNSSDGNVFVPTEKRNVGMVFQSYAIWPHMTVFDNIAYPLRVRRASRATIAEKVERTLELLSLHGLANRPATQLSGGQQQRVALARALVFEPRVLLLDEPLSNLDARLRVQMRAELKHLQQATGITSIFVTHDQAESMALADRIIVMNRGRIEQVGSPAEIYERPRTRFVSEFVGSINMLHGRVTAVAGSQLTVRYGGFGEHDIRGLAGSDAIFGDGDAVMATIRPEKLSLVPEQVNGTLNYWPARVASMAYYGDHREYEVEIGDQRIKVVTPADLNVDKDAHVFVACDPADVVVIADAGD